MIPELVKTILMAYAIVGIATILIGSATKSIVNVKIETMAKKSFEEKVANMRRLQKEYFRIRCSMTLTSAKRAEAEVDEALCALFPKQQAVVSEDEHPSLFK